MKRISFTSLVTQGEKVAFFSGFLYLSPNGKTIDESRTLLTAELEPTNDAYAIAKIMGIKMCHTYNQQYGTKYISVMPTNLYGIVDNFVLATSYVLRL